MPIDEFRNSDFNKDFIVNGVAAMPGGFFIYRADYEKEEIIYANRALLLMFECDTSEEFIELTGGTFKGVVFPDDYESVQKSIKSQIETNAYKFDRVSYRIKTRTGQVKYVEDFGSYIIDEKEGPLFYVFISDPQGNIDPVTGLCNKKILFQNVDLRLHTIDENAHPAIIAFDLNGMRGFNAKYGFLEGDKLLRFFGEILREIFGNEYCSRFGEDHFCAYTDEYGIEDILSEVVDLFMNGNDGKNLPVKIGICHYEKDISLYDLYERARLACQTQKAFYGSSIGYYDETMAKDFSKNEYLLSHLDMAIENGWIKVFLQPVVRSLTRRICSAEALTRWIDPDLGFISPGDFVPLLERMGLSFKLDTYMVNQVAEILANEIKNGREPVPVSVNISRSDFVYCDPVQIVTEALDRYNLRRSLICVEITESAFTDQPEIIKEAIDRFHYEGIDVWMDDFGSGYSSLNVLKDFNFDEIKIDMVFLRNFDEKSKIIVTKAVQMAKELGVHTLAEGVETIEHVEFLKSIGCEKIQGYYYAKPMSYEDQMAHVKKTGLTFENMEMASIYEKTGLVNLATFNSRALFFYTKGVFKPVFLNEPYINTISRTGMTSEEIIEKNMNSLSSLVSKKFRDLAEKTIKSKKTEFMTFVIRDVYFSFTFKDVADSRYGSMLLASIDRTSYEDKEASDELDRVFRNIGTAYDSIYLIDLDEDTRTVISTSLPDENVGDKIKGLNSFYSKYSARDIYPEDYRRWEEFFKKESVEGIFNANSHGIFADAVRMKDTDGNYRWIDFTIIHIPESDEKRFLVCVRPSVLEFQPDLANAAMPIRYTLDQNNYDKDLIRAIVRESNLKLFWKDSERRFLGASDAFLNYYGFSSVTEILGKTDEEVGWHIDDSHFHSVEESVLKKGKISRNAIGKNIINGVIHNIAATKFPIYENGKIVGLMGYFFDIDEDINSDDNLSKGGLMDPKTGMMNMYGQMGILIELFDNYLQNKEDFAYICFEVTSYDDIVKDYGSEVAEDLIRLISSKILDVLGPKVTIARIYGANFGITARKMTLEEAEINAEKLSDVLREVKEIDNRQCSLRVIYGISLGSERETVQEVTELARQRSKGKGIPLP
ncbi:MAG: EAL domain-containing protein [Lachnospiraceae bacterium]|nr:EAL domain-containing protein [Lachnospiraceae bacterium]